MAKTAKPTRTIVGWQKQTSPYFLRENCVIMFIAEQFKRAFKFPNKFSSSPYCSDPGFGLWALGSFCFTKK
jgi:hypothetical protein